MEDPLQSTYEFTRSNLLLSLDGYQALGRKISTALFTPLAEATNINICSYNPAEYQKFGEQLWNNVLSMPDNGSLGIGIVFYTCIGFCLLLLLTGSIVFCCKQFGKCRNKRPSTNRRVKQCLYYIFIYLIITILSFSILYMFRYTRQATTVIQQQIRPHADNMGKVYESYIKRTTAELADVEKKVDLIINDMHDTVQKQARQIHTDVRQKVSTEVVTSIDGAYGKFIGMQDSLANELDYNYVNGTYIVADLAKLQTNLSILLRKLDRNLVGCKLPSTKSPCPRIKQLVNETLPVLKRKITFSDSRKAADGVRAINFGNLRQQVSFEDGLFTDLKGSIDKLENNLREKSTTMQKDIRLEKVVKFVEHYKTQYETMTKPAITSLTSKLHRDRIVAFLNTTASVTLIYSSILVVLTILGTVVGCILPIGRDRRPILKYTIIFSWVATALFSIGALIAFFASGIVTTTCNRAKATNDYFISVYQTECHDPKSVIPFVEYTQNGKPQNMTVQTFLDKCENNDSIFKIFNETSIYGNVLDIPSIYSASQLENEIRSQIVLTKAKITHNLESYKKRIDTYRADKMKLIDNLIEVTKQLDEQELANQKKLAVSYFNEINVVMDEFRNKISTDLMTEQFSKEKQAIDTAIEELRKKFPTKLKSITDYSNSVGQITQMRGKIGSIKSKFNASINEAKKVIDALPDMIQKHGDQTVTQISGYWNDKSGEVQKTFSTSVGKCDSLSGAYKSLDNMICRDIAPSLSGYWFSLFVITVLLLLLTVIGWKLLKYYKGKTENYQNAEYVGDTYSEECRSLSEHIDS